MAKTNMSIKDKKGAYEFKNSNLRFHGIKMDINGNPCFVLSTPNQRAFSVQQPYSITIHWSTKNGNSKESGVEIVEKNTKGNPFKSEEEFESYVLDLAKGKKHVKVYGNNFACGKGNFGISTNPNYVGDWFGEGQIDKEKILNNDGEGDVYLVKIWSGSGYALDVYLVRAIDFYEAIDIVFEWSRKNEKDMIFSRKEVEEFAEDAWKDYGKRKGGEKEDFIEDFIDTEFIASSDYDLFARSENFFVDKVPQEGDNFSILDDTKDVLKAGGKLAGNVVKDTLYNGGILMF